jgi:septum formation protein
MIQAAAPRLVLASASAARRALLEGAGLRFETQAASVDEAAIKESAQAEAIPPADAALMLADAKAERVARRDPGALVIGCDQLLVCEGAWFDKPVDLAAARAQLLALRGKTHDLVTAVVCHRDGARI